MDWQFLSEEPAYSWLKYLQENRNSLWGFFGSKSGDVWLRFPILDSNGDNPSGPWILSNFLTQ